MGRRSAVLKKPDTRIHADSETIIKLRLWREGLGTPAAILELPTDQVLEAWEFVKFQDEYSETLAELNKPEP